MVCATTLEQLAQKINNKHKLCQEKSNDKIQSHKRIRKYSRRNGLRIDTSPSKLDSAMTLTLKAQTL